MTARVTMGRVQTVKELIYKRGYGKVNKDRIPLTDNAIVEQVASLRSKMHLHAVRMAAPSLLDREGRESGGPPDACVLAAPSRGRPSYGLPVLIVGSPMAAAIAKAGCCSALAASVAAASGAWRVLCRCFPVMIRSALHASPVSGLSATCAQHWEAWAAAAPAGRSFRYDLEYCLAGGQALGKYNIICVEDLVHEIVTCGPNFKAATNFLWPFKLSAPKVPTPPSSPWPARAPGLPFNVCLLVV